MLTCVRMSANMPSVNLSDGSSRDTHCPTSDLPSTPSARDRICAANSCCCENSSSRNVPRAFACQRASTGNSSMRCIRHLLCQAPALPRQLALSEYYRCVALVLHHLARLLPGVLLHAQHERRAHAVDHGIGPRGSDDLAPQPVPFHVGTEALLQRLRQV